jgi:hypothetical protein
MKKRLLLVVLLALLLAAAGLLGWRDGIKNGIESSVSVVFLGYTNVDMYGFKREFTLGWFRLENHSPFNLACRQGPLDVERAGIWIQDTNRVGYPPDPIIEEGQTLIVSIRAPSGVTRWRSSYVLRAYPPVFGWRYRFQIFMDHLRLHRFGFRWRLWVGRDPKPHVVKSETLGL